MIFVLKIVNTLTVTECKTYQRRIQDFLVRQPIIWPNFPENCLKMKKIGPRRGGARPKFHYIDPPLPTVFRVARTQGKLGIRMFIFPDRETLGILPETKIM